MIWDLNSQFPKTVILGFDFGNKMKLKEQEVIHGRPMTKNE